MCMQKTHVTEDGRIQGQREQDRGSQEEGEASSSWQRQQGSPQANMPPSFLCPLTPYPPAV